MLTPEQFSTLASAWIGAFFVVLAVLGAALTKAYPVIKKIKEDIENLFAKHEENKKAIEGNQQSLTEQQAQIVYVAAAKETK